MAPNEYSKALDKALSDLEQRVQQRDLLTAEIAGLRETVRVLSTLVRIPADKQRDIAKLLALADYATPSLTDAIRSLLTRVYPKAMSAVEVRNALEDSSNSEDFSNSLSACHAALKRMLADGEVEPGPTKDGKATYSRVIELEHVLPSRIYGRAIPESPNVFANLFADTRRTLSDLAGSPGKPLPNADDLAREAEEKNLPVEERTLRRAVGRKKNRAFYGE
ncbi:MAG TPA: hypothetical protein VFF64_11725 [Candidatus Eremiobacteraceae bacterium]|nr:hypothetical protein [Candidatus Eremiobacteraceae bacterium]